MSSAVVLSESEREFILGGVRDDVRADGRGCRHVRHFSLQTGVVSNTSGSALIERERTSAIIGVKAELDRPHPSTPNEGRLEFHVDCSALAGPIFERRGGELLGQRLAEHLEEAYSSASCVDRKSLSVIPGEQCWVLYVDALMLEVGGSLLDALSIGVRAALQSTLVPRLTVTGEGEEMEIEVSDNPHDSTPVAADGAPVVVTLHQLGGRYVVDCALEEELCSGSQLRFAVDRDGHVLSSSMEGAGSVPYSDLSSIIKMALEVAEEILNSVDARKADMPTTSTKPSLFS